MTETQQKQIPRPAMANWRERHHCLQRAAKIKASADDVARKIADAEDDQRKLIEALQQGEAYLKELRGQLAAKADEHAQEVADAQEYEWFVQAWADKDNGGQLPPPMGEVPLADTVAAPIHSDLPFPMPPNVQDARQPGDDPLRSGVYPAAPTVPDGPYGGDGVEDARFHPNGQPAPGTGPGGGRA